MLAFLNRHLPLTDAQRSLFRQSQDSGSGGNAELAASSHDMSNESDHDRSSKASSSHDQEQSHGQTWGMTAGQVMNGKVADGVSKDQSLSGRTGEYRVKAEERAVFEDVCKGHIAILELSL